MFFENLCKPSGVYGPEIVEQQLRIALKEAGEIQRGLILIEKKEQTVVNAQEATEGLKTHETQPLESGQEQSG